MKKTITILFSILLIACAPTEVKEEHKKLNFDQVLAEFDAIDAQFGTNWKKEQIPNNMIPFPNLPAWTEKTLALENLTEKDTPERVLVEIRLDMISAQTSYYLGQQIGEKGQVKVSKQNETWKLDEPINCDNLEDIAKATKLYWLSYQSWINFMNNMDLLLQKDKPSREKIGSNDNRVSFYTAPFGQAEDGTKAIVKAVENSCGKTINLD